MSAQPIPQLDTDQRPNPAVATVNPMPITHGPGVNPHDIEPGGFEQALQLHDRSQPRDLDVWGGRDLQNLMSDESAWATEHETAEGLNRSAIRKVKSSQPTSSPVVVAFPNGANVQFPSIEHAQKHSSSVWDQLKSTVVPVLKTAGREYNAAYDTLNTLPQQLYQAVTTPLSEDEKSVLGIKGEGSFAERLAGHVARVAGGPAIANAAAYWKRYAQASPDEQIRMQSDILGVSPEAVGSAAPMPVLGRLLEGPQSKFTPATETSARPTSRPVPVVESAPKSVAAVPLTEDQLAQEFIAKHFPDAKAEIKSGELGNVEPKPISAEELDRTIRATLRRHRATAVGQPVVEGEAHEPGTVSVNPAEAQAAAREFLKRVPKPEGIELEGSEGAAEESHAAKISGEASQGRGGKPRSQVLLEDENATATAFLNRLEQQKELLKSERGEAVIPFTGKGGIEPNAPNAPTFFSKAAQVANDKVPNSASGEQVLSTLRNNGVKESEIQWLGLDDYLKGKSKVSKADLQAYINNHRIELKDVNLGSTPEQEQQIQLSKQRDKLYAENNKIWGDNFKYDPTGLFTELVEAMKQGTDLGIKQTIDRMPDAYKQPARRFVESDRQMVDLDNQISKLQYQIDHSDVKEPRYEKYTLSGEKSNYQEKLLTLPAKNESRIAEIDKQLNEMSNRPSAEHQQHPEWKDQWDNLQNERARLSSGTAAQKAYDDFVTRMQNKYVAGGQWAQKLNAAEEVERQRLSQAVRDARESDSRFQFTSSHFDQPNVVAHVRYSDRPSLDGKKTLFIEEAQSDWAQKGRSKGYNDPNVRSALERQIADLEQERRELMHNGQGPQGAADDKQIARYEEINRTLTGLKRTFNATHKGVPDMPFKNNWHELVMKKMLREAAEKGYDRLAWTTGDQQAERYDLSKQVSEISYDPEEQVLYARDHSGKEVIHETNVQPERLADYIGKEPAQKLIKAAEDWKSSYNTDEWKVEPQEFKPKPEDEIDGLSWDHKIQKVSNALSWDHKVMMGMPAEFGYNYTTIDNPNQLQYAPKGAKFYKGSKSYFVRNPNGDLWLERDGNPTTFTSEKDAKKFIEWMAEQDKRAEGLPKLSGLDLKVGGESLKNLYDKTMPQFLKGYVKKWGAKVGTTDLSSGKNFSVEYDPKREKENWTVIEHGKDGRQLRGTWKSEDAANRFKKDVENSSKTRVHSIEITPAMRKSVMTEGQPISRNNQPQFDWKNTVLSSVVRPQAA